MPEQLLIQFREDKALREDFRSAFNALREESADIPEMSLEELNSEISEIRSNRKRGQSMAYVCGEVF